MGLAGKIGELFDFLPETNLVEEYLYNNFGNYPVYSGQTEGQGILGYIDSYNQRLPCITFTTYGVRAGKIFYREGKYTIGRNCMGLRPKKKYWDDIDLKWFAFSFQNLFYRLRIGDPQGQRSLNKLLLERIPIVIPDINIQKRQLRKYKRLADIQKILQKTVFELIHIGNFTKGYPSNSIVAEDKLKTFVKFKGGNSGLTEEFIYHNSAEINSNRIKVLTSSTSERTAMGFVSKNAKPNGKTLKIFQTPAILVARNGYAGTMTYVPNEIFTTNDHAYVLTPKKEWKDKINLEWFMHEYQDLFFRLVTSKSDNATFSKEYAEKQIVQIPHIDYQNTAVQKINVVKKTQQQFHVLQMKMEQLLEFRIV